MQQQKTPLAQPGPDDGEVMTRAFALFNALIDQLEEEVLVIDVNGVILNLNGRLVQAWGGAREDYVGKAHAELFGESGNRMGGKLVEMAKSTGRHVSDTFTDVTDDGRMRHYHANAFPLRDEAGAVRYFVLTRRDTTAQEQIEQRLYQSQKMAAIGELSTYVAHEIRNPLFAIGGFANSLLRAPSLDEAAREKARVILDESRRLDEILKSIINFARPTDQDVGAVNINTVAKETVELLRMGAEERAIPIELELTEGVPRVHGNEDLLKQCLINLVKNAQEAMGEKGGTVRVRTRQADATVYLEVEDNGPGIPPELQDKIFSPFFSTKDKGAGLGLAMTRKILNEINGEIRLFSAVGKGTLMSMALKPVLAVIDPDGPDALGGI